MYLCAGTGLHAECQVGCRDLSIPFPCLLKTSGNTVLTCTANALDSSTIVLHSESVDRPHITGQLHLFSTQTSLPRSSARVPGKALLPGKGNLADPLAVSQIADRRSDHHSGFWSHPAVVDCSLHLAAALANPAGKKEFEALQPFYSIKTMKSLLH